MLTAFQVDRIAYAPVDEFYGEFVCRGCAIAQLEAATGVTFDEPDTWAQDDITFEAIGLEAWSRYAVDEFDLGGSEGIHEGDKTAPEYCACTYGVACSVCGNWIVEPFVDEYEHDKQDES